jgi:hypothetical protein
MIVGTSFLHWETGKKLAILTPIPLYLYIVDYLSILHGRVGDLP